MAYTLMRLNFVHPDPSDAEEMSSRYRAGIELAEYVDRHGFDGITLEEHHSNPIAWSPTPLLNAGMILARTEKVTVMISALILPLHDPVRVAEEVAVLDLVSRGRIIVCTGLGYRPEEYAAMDREWDRRGRILDESLEVLMKAWAGEPFEHNGEMVQVTPRPYTRPHPPVFIGGSGPAAARRAARLGLPLQLPGAMPEIEALYLEECERLGTPGFCIAPKDIVMAHIAEDPDRVWAEFGEHFMVEAKAYRDWQLPGQSSAVSSKASTPEELRAEGIYRVLTPGEAVELVGSSGLLSLHPLVGGMPVEQAWSSVELAVQRVLPGI